VKNHDGFGVLIFAFKSKASLYFVAALVNAFNFSKELALAKCKNPDFRNLLCQDKNSYRPILYLAFLASTLGVEL